MSTSAFLCVEQTNIDQLIPTGRAEITPHLLGLHVY